MISLDIEQINLETLLYSRYWTYIDMCYWMRKQMFAWPFYFNIRESYMYWIQVELQTVLIVSM